MPQRRFGLLAIAVAFLLSGCSVKITGMYTNMHFVGNGSNVQGVEMLIVRGDKDQYFAVLQCANGAPGKPVVLSATIPSQEQVEVAANSDPASHCPMTQFKGKVGPSGITGSFAGGPEMSLERKDSYWQ
jgi:hypothetical protein